MLVQAPAEDGEGPGLEVGMVQAMTLTDVDSNALFIIEGEDPLKGGEVREGITMEG
jgi:hypothetical protein